MKIIDNTFQLRSKSIKNIKQNINSKLLRFKEINSNQIVKNEPQVLKQTNNISNSQGKYKIFKSQELDKGEYQTDSKEGLIYLKLQNKNGKQLECGKNPDSEVINSNKIKSVQFIDKKINQIIIQKHKISSKIISFEFIYQNMHKVNFGRIENFNTDEYEQFKYNPNIMKIPLIVTKCSNYVNGIQFIQFEGLSQQSLKLGITNGNTMIDNNFTSKETLHKIKGFKSIEYLVNNDNLNIKQINITDFENKEFKCGNQTGLETSNNANSNSTSPFSKVEFNQDSELKKIEIYQTNIQNIPGIGKIVLYSDEVMTLGENNSTNHSITNVNTKYEDIAYIQMSCGDQINDFKIIYIKHHIVPNIMPNFTQQIRNVGKEGDENYLFFDKVNQKFIINNVLDSNSHFDFINIEEDIYQIKFQDKYLSADSQDGKLKLVSEIKDEDRFRVINMSEKIYKIELLESNGGLKQVGYSNSKSKVELSNKFGLMQSWEVEFVNMKMENVSFDLENAQITNSFDRVQSDNYTNNTEVKLQHEFVFEREIEDMYVLKTACGFNLTKDRLIETQELKIKPKELTPTNELNQSSSTAEFNTSKPLQLTMGENKVSNQINLSKSVEVSPKREIISYLKMNKQNLKVDLSLALVDKITNYKFYMGIKLSITLQRDPSVEFEHISEEINCQQRGTKKTHETTGEAYCQCEEGFEGKLCESPICDKQCNQGSCKVNVTENNERQMTCKCNEDYMGPDCTIPKDLIRFEGNHVCKGEKCVCADGWQGQTCDLHLNPPDCNGHGLLALGKCQCDEGWRGEKCDCNVECQHGGICRQNLCQCAPGQVGEQCETLLTELIEQRTSKLCLNDCSGEGVCQDGLCNCKEGQQGLDCSCAVSCKNGGICESGSCKCPRGFQGETCEFLGCKMNCSGQGECVEGRCECFTNFTGEICDKPICEDNCNGHGDCYINEGQPLCKCHKGYSSPKCNPDTCPVECTANGGMCHDNKCLCPGNRTGENCKVSQCKNGCNGNGYCTEANQCLCNDTWQGEDCSERICQNNCSGNGECILPQQHCNCNPGYTQADCAMKKCPNDCNLKGTCNYDDGFENPKCECDIGQKGHDCSQRQCFKECNKNGNCLNGICQCNQFFTGIDCSERLCPYNCNNNGVCEPLGKCSCNQGFSGDYCEHKTCPNNCSGRGNCLDGLCQCDAGQTGPDCGVRACPNNCSGNGNCEQDNGNPYCVCASGFEGQDCSTVVCPNECSKRGQCENGVCHCNEFWKGADCSLPKCTADCNSRGACGEFNQCTCEPPAQGKFCEKVRCAQVCVFGTCDTATGECVCSEGHFGADCGRKQCSVPDCHQGGVCNDDIGKCVCDQNHSGADCGVVQCAECDGYCLHDTFTVSGQSGSCIHNACDLECDHGKCQFDGQGSSYCQCEDGYTGQLCSKTMCEFNCKHGVCTDNKCECLKNWTGQYCDNQQVDLKNVVIQTVEDYLEECKKMDQNKFEQFRFARIDPNQSKVDKNKDKILLKNDGKDSVQSSKQLNLLSRFKFSKSKVNRCSQLYNLLQKFKNNANKLKTFSNKFNKKGNETRIDQIQKNKSDTKNIDLKVENKHIEDEKLKISTDFKSKNTSVKIKTNNELNHSKSEMKKDIK